MPQEGSRSASLVAVSASGELAQRHEEPEDILSAFLGVIYDYTAITHSEAGSTFVYAYTGPTNAFDRVSAHQQEDIDNSRWISDPIKLTLHTPDTQARNWELHASSIWAVAVFLADHTGELSLDHFMRDSEAEVGCTDERRLHVLELGAGAGLPGLLVAKYLKRIEEIGRTIRRATKEWSVTLSDYPDELLIENLRTNVRRNGFNAESQSTDTSNINDHVHVVPYAWGENISALLSSSGKAVEQDGFDLIIAADTLWNAALHECFARTLYSLLRRKPDARIHLVSGLHTGRYALSGFLRTVQSLGPCVPEGANENDRLAARLEVVKITERKVNGHTEREWREDREREDEVERRRWVVWIVLGWSNLQMRKGGGLVFTEDELRELASKIRGSQLVQIVADISDFIILRESFVRSWMAIVSTSELDEGETAQGSADIKFNPGYLVVRHTRDCFKE